MSATVTEPRHARLFRDTAETPGSQKKNRTAFTFIDLFAGIGGFHLALRELGGTCVAANDIDTDAADVYEANFGIAALGDIRTLDAASLPDFEMLCAGFPCQPFSKGGRQAGFQDTRGTLFFDMCKIIEAKRPALILLENVPNLASHDRGRTYRVIIETLKQLGYRVPASPLMLSPDMFGIPVHRPRVYIPCIRGDLSDLEHVVLDLPRVPLRRRALSLVDRGKKDPQHSISAYERRVLDMWNEFYHGIDLKVIGFPVWADEFGATYAYDDLPAWKQTFIEKNRALYQRNKTFVRTWLRAHDHLRWCQPSHRKFEWQAGNAIDDIYEGLIQFRPSGVRVRKPDRFSTLVAMNHAQIVGRYGRRLTPDETKRLQSFPDWFRLHPETAVALRQLGNAVHVAVVREVARALRRLLPRS